MAPDLPEKLLGIDIDDADARSQQSTIDQEEEEDQVRVVGFGVGGYRLAVPVADVRTTTDRPDDLTSVPRTPEAIAGITDLRGEITAVIDPTVHFPPKAADASASKAAAGAAQNALQSPSETATHTAEREQLLVFDRGSDDQSAAIRVEQVYGVDAVPESNVFDSTAIDDSDLSGDALEHPLVDELVTTERTERRPGDRTRGSEPTAPDAGSVGTSNAAVIESADEFSAEGDEPGSDADVDTALEPPTAASADRAKDDRENEREDDPRTVIEVTPVIDVEKLLLASGPIEPSSAELES
ncbi:chemotaxis protein CheW [Natrialba taiwanensis]|uniref:CheW protein n=1 Tax=Natrialba taiwanensis DSM 12281 TaxID=1230458 RepID=L9ZGG2_9EURY|nr:chemotaxis protein CheW [Natrialba taiwanensis]ELY85136.1 CheW protein [Natrialba taiwanensis DSM 12281]